MVNVLAVHHGSGLGQQLLTQALAATASTGPASLWVLRGNDRARAFYARNGFAPDGLTKVHERSGAVEERWVRPGVDDID